MAFVSGTEWFRKVQKDVGPHFKKGVPFAGGDKFPLMRGVVQKEKLDEKVKNHMYPVLEQRARERRQRGGQQI